jgi:hypothetical protein
MFVGDARLHRIAEQMYALDKSVGVAQSPVGKSRLPCSECCLGPTAYGTRLFLSHSSEDMNGQAIHRRHVGADELYAAFHQAAYEVHIACKPIELGQTEDGVGAFAEGKRFRKLRPIVLST